MLYFLHVAAGEPARLLHLYFIGDCFPDGRRCPASDSQWHELIRARELTLGLPERHAISSRVHDVFLPAIVPAAV
jgi:hypothetical protein